LKRGIKTKQIHRDDSRFVAFTPKGGCPLKHKFGEGVDVIWGITGSIHPQGWVPIETNSRRESTGEACLRSIHPQGWVPIETVSAPRKLSLRVRVRSIHPQGWVPIETLPHTNTVRHWSHSM